MKDLALIVTSYAPPPSRMKELLHCLEQNLRNPLISEIHVFIEEDGHSYERIMERPPYSYLKEFLDNSKVRTVKLSHRATYRELFDYGNSLLRDRIVMVSNADIWFDESLGYLQDAPLTNAFICLSRKDQALVPRHAKYSQDTWIFRSPLKTFPCDWFLGPRGADNRVAYEAWKAGLRVLNPCHAIHSHHEHKSGTRVGITLEEVKGAKLNVAACGLKELLEGQSSVIDPNPAMKGPEGAFGEKRPKERKLDVRPKGPW